MSLTTDKFDSHAIITHNEVQSRKQRLQLKKKTKETLANLYSVLLEHHYLALRNVIMGKREVAAKVSMGIATKYSFVDDSFDKYFCISRGLEGFP